MAAEVLVGNEGLQGLSEEWIFHPPEEGESYSSAYVHDVNQEDVGDGSFN